MLFEITLAVDVELDTPLTVQERARLEEVFGLELLAELEDPDAPITPLQTRAVIWAKLQSRFPGVAIDQFDSVEGLGASVG